MGQRPPRHKARMANRSVRCSADAVAIHASYRWRLYSIRMRRRYPLCAASYHDGPLAASREVHHIVPLHRDPSLAYVESNTIPLCCACHDYVEELLQAGKPTTHLFNDWTNGECARGICI